MKRMAISIGAMLLLSAFGQAAERQRGERGQPGREPAAQRQEMTEQRQAVERLQKQVEELRAGHQELIEQLRALHATASKEKATETAGQIEKLISSRQQAYQDALRPMEQQLERLQRATRERAGRMDRGERRGRGAPEFELNSFEGKPVKLADYKGKIVVLEWFNMECPFVQYHYNQTSTMIDLANKYKDKDVVWLAVNSTSGTTPQANRDFAKKHKLPYPILDDRTGRVGRSYGAGTTPHMFVIGKDGQIVYDGAIDNAPLGKQLEEAAGRVNYVDQAVSQLLAGQRVTVPNTRPYGCSVKYPQQ